MADGLLLSDSVVYSQSGKVVSGNENGLAKTYGYDKASRLTSAVIGANTYGYEFGAVPVVESAGALAISTSILSFIFYVPPVEQKQVVMTPGKFGENSNNTNGGVIT